jgi:hypothetical protein
MQVKRSRSLKVGVATLICMSLPAAVMVRNQNSDVVVLACEYCTEDVHQRKTVSTR